jgi:hypothetical protein
MMMNRYFNFRRFFALEKYYAKETIIFCILLFSIIAGTYIITLYLNVSESIDSAPFVKRIGLLLFMFSPCLFEKRMNSYNSVLDFMLPSSVLEKYLHLWIKYYIISPMVITLSVILMFFITKILFGGQMFVNEVLSAFSFDYSFIWLIAVFQPVFFTGYFLFKKKFFLKSLTSSLIIIIISVTIISLMEYFIPEGVEINNLLANPIYNFPLSDEHQFAIEVSTFFPLIFVVGLWISSYMLFKEKEI